MLIRHIDDIIGSEQEVSGDGWTSYRMLLARDGMGFSMHETHIHAGAELHMHYKHHLEAVYCIAGRGTIYDCAHDVTHVIEAGILYALDSHDKHILTAETELRMICVFNPPVHGGETHDASGAYPPSTV